MTDLTRVILLGGLGSILTSLTLLSIVGCAARPATPPQDSTTNPALAAMRSRLAADGSVSFRSNNGIAYRMDGDTELTFYLDGKACMLEWGLSGEEFWGNYRLYPDGCVVSWFKNYQSEWPAMGLQMEGPELLLLPLNPPNELRRERPEDATQPADHRYWQFRALHGKERQGVLETIERWRERVPPDN